MSQNPYDKVLKTIDVDGKQYKFYSLPDLKDNRYGTAIGATKVNIY
jgi:hypothetical protein